MKLTRGERIVYRHLGVVMHDDPMARDIDRAIRAARFAPCEECRGGHRVRISKRTRRRLERYARRHGFSCLGCAVADLVEWMD